MTQFPKYKGKAKSHQIDYWCASSGTHIAGGGSGAVRQSNSCFGVQGTGTAYVSGLVDLLKQVKQFMARVKQEKFLQGKN